MLTITDYGRRMRKVDIAIGILLLLSLILIGYFALIGGQGPGGLSKSGPVEVHFIDVGKGDSVLVKAAGKSMLVDGGRQVEGPGLVAYLKSQGVESIEIVVATHPHADHIGGLLAVLREFPVKEVLDSGIPHTTQTYESYLALIDEKNIAYTVAEAGQVIDLAPGVQVEVLAPPVPRIEDGINENSIVLRVVHHGVSFLLMADAGVPEETYLAGSGYDLRSDVYKVPHHGSWYSASGEFLMKVSPTISVIEVGPNPYGQPAAGVLTMLEEAGSVVYRTDRNGHVVVVSDGAGFTVTPQYDTGSAGYLSCSPANSRMRCAA